MCGGGSKAVAQPPKKARCCTVPRAIIAGGLMAFLGSALCIGGALTPWLTLPGISIGLLTACADTGGVSTCASFSASGLAANVQATAAAALLLLGFALSLALFLLSALNSYKCCLGPCTNRARLALALLGFLFTVVGTVVAASALSTNGLNLAGVLQSSPALVGPGLGLAIGATLLQLIALCVVLFSVCCQKKVKVVERVVVVEKVVEKVVVVEVDKGSSSKGRKGANPFEEEEGKAAAASGRKGGQNPFKEAEAAETKNPLSTGKGRK